MKSEKSDHRAFCFALIPVGLHALLTTGYFSFVLSFFFIVYRGRTVSHRSACFIKTIKLKLKQRAHAMKLTGLFMMGEYHGCGKKTDASQYLQHMVNFSMCSDLSQNYGIVLHKPVKTFNIWWHRALKTYRQWLSGLISCICLWGTADSKESLFEGIWESEGLFHLMGVFLDIPPVKIIIEGKINERNGKASHKGWERMTTHGI